MTSETRQSIGPLWGLFLALALLMLGNGLSASLIGIRTQTDSFSSTATALVTAAYYVGFLGSSFIVPKIVSRVGHIRVFAALASTASIAALVHGVFGSPVTWGFMRVFTGASMAGLYVVVESWLNSRATNRNRGRLLAVYMVVLMGGYGLGQFLLNLTDPTGFQLFVLASVLLSLAVLPVTLAQSPAPELKITPRMSLRAFAKLSPLATVAGFLTGASNAAIAGMGAIYGVRAGMPTSRIAVFMAITYVGGVALQFPLGQLSDRFPRRRVLLGTSAAATLVALVATTVDARSTTMLALVFVYGGLAFPMYSLAISHINDVVPADGFVASAAAYLFITGAGAIVGPLITESMMSALGTPGYWWSHALFYAPVAVVAVHRILRRALPNRGVFAPVPARMSPVLNVMIEAYESEHERSSESAARRAVRR